MSVKFLYLDDETEQQINSFVRILNNPEIGLEITFRNPKTYSEQIGELVRELTQGVFDGVILDFRLDIVSKEDGKPCEFRATTIAQEVRTRSVEQSALEVPIVLLSASKYFASYKRDNTSHDLFDRAYLKEDINKSVSTELHDLVKGYHSIIEGRNNQFPFYKILSLKEEYKEILDIRIQDIFPKNEPEPVHKYAQFILKEMIDVPGPLIDELTLATRLGVDIENSPDWKRLLSEFLISSAYQGPFCEAWPRWWSILMEQWWGTLEGAIESLPFLNAASRVEILKQNTQLEALQAAKPIEQGYSSNFWTVCQARKRPLDPIDGFMIQSREQYPWQERQYVSKIAALYREERAKGLKVHPFDREHLREYTEEMDSQIHD